MVINKIVNATQLDDDLTDIADAIRAKSGGSAALAFPQGFVSEIGNIPSGGGGISADEIAETADNNHPSITGAVVLTRAMTIRAYAFSGTRISSVSSDKAITLGNECFSSNPSLISVTLPNATNGMNRGNCFYNCSGLTSADLRSLDKAGTGMFRGCSSLPKMALPAINALGQSAFYDCRALAAVDIGPNLSATPGNTCFGNCSVLKAVVLRRTTGITPLGNINIFQNSPFASGGSGGTLYVPQALISTYQSATNWSTILGYANNQILPIEGSIYETQYADGTPVA